jgi:predicted MFS family arabinose efflux permease
VTDLRRALLGTWLAFAVTGAVAATWASRIPAVQDRLDLGPGGLAVVVLGVEGGALAGLPAGGWLVGRWGSRAALRGALVAFLPALVPAALAPSLVVLVPTVALWAAANSVVDVALNAQGVELERRAGRPVLSRLHAGQGAGLLGGAAAGTAAAALGVPFPAHAAAVAVVGLAVGLPATALLVREAPVRRRGRVSRDRGLLVLGAVAFCVFLVDGAAGSWIAVHLRSTHGTGEGGAAAAYLGFTAALVLGRLGGDRLTARFSRRGVVRGCSLGMAAGVAAAVLAPGAVWAAAGWALTGLALAPLAPAVLGAAPGAGRTPAPAAIAVVTTIGYLGSFSGPPLVGVLAERWSLSPALGLLVAAAVVAALLAPAALRTRRR